MPHDHHTIRPPAQGGIAYVEPAKRLQQWLQGRARGDGLAGGRDARMGRAALSFDGPLGAFTRA